MEKNPKESGFSNSAHETLDLAKREHFAAIAMQAYIARQYHPKDAAIEAVAAADYLVEALAMSREEAREQSKKMHSMQSGFFDFGPM
jgi:hypothetical protein